MKGLNSAIINTLIYADIFNYPLTLPQLHLFLISRKSYSLLQIKSALKHLSIVSYQPPFYYFSGRKSLLPLRRQKAYFSSQKLHLAKKTALFLARIPTVELVAVTGALSMKNACLEDDIDLMIITRPHALWLTRLFTTILLELTGRRRHPQDPHPQNKFCLNLFLSQDALTLKPAQRNLYTAHEVVQILPLINKHQTYEQFLFQNRWVNHYLPNFTIDSVQSFSKFFPCSFPEVFCYRLQLLYMKPKITNEKISLAQAFFHPRNTAQIVLKKYQKRQAKYL